MRVMSLICNRGQRGYRFKQAEAKAQARHAIRKRPRKLTAPLRRKIEAKLRQMRWSPEQISGWRFEQGIKLSHERIYQMIWQDKRDGGDLWRSLRRRGNAITSAAGSPHVWSNGLSPAPGRHVRSWRCLARRLRSRRKIELRWRRPEIGRKHCRIDGGEKHTSLGRFAAKGHESFRRGHEIARSQRRIIFHSQRSQTKKDLYRYKCSLPLVPCDRGTRI